MKAVMPANWDAGFKAGSRYRPACGGTEVPVYYGDCGWTLLVWDSKRLKRALYVYASDTFLYDLENYI